MLKSASDNTSKSYLLLRHQLLLRARSILCLCRGSSSLEAFYVDPDLGLGCGLPTEFARIMSGNTVVDLGSGAGNNCFVAREQWEENEPRYRIKYAGCVGGAIDN